MNTIRRHILCGAVTLAVGLAATSEACNSFYLPDYDLSVAYAEYSGPERLSIMIVPDGSGDALAAAFLPDGSRTSGVITVQLVNPAGEPSPDYCREKITLSATGGDLAFCPEGACADAHTDADGITRFSGPLHGGGSSEGRLQVLVNNGPLTSSPGLAITVNSPDLNADLSVDLSDVVLFAEDFHGSYRYRSDFYCDGEINLSDVTRMAQSLGAGCP